MSEALKVELTYREACLILDLLTLKAEEVNELADKIGNLHVKSN